MCKKAKPKMHPLKCHDAARPFKSSALNVAAGVAVSRGAFFEFSCNLAPEFDPLSNWSDAEIGCGTLAAQRTLLRVLGRVLPRTLKRVLQ